MDSICKLCNAPFKRDIKHLLYCSLTCSIQANKELTQLSFRKKLAEKLKSERVIKICEQCNMQYEPHSTSKQRFCTRQCAKANERLLWATRGEK